MNPNNEETATDLSKEFLFENGKPRIDTVRVVLGQVFFILQLNS